MLAVASPGTYAHRGATGIVKQRMDAMTSIAGAMKALRAMMRGKQAYDAKRVKAYARAIAGHGAGNLTALFPEGSLKHPSRANPAIWADWDRFSALARQLAVYADALASAASNPRASAPSSDADIAMPHDPAPEDLAAMAPDAVFIRLQQAGSDCHRTFRKKSDSPARRFAGLVGDMRL